jgi:alpha-D-ribose 1-methylphosphonate 5-triphosphate diphosphatase
VNHGITSIYHSLSFADGELGIRAVEKVVEAVRAIHRTKSSALISHEVHARYEITDAKSFQLLNKLIDQRQVQLLSFMDHTPGQGQFRRLEEYEAFLQKTYRLSQDEIRRILQEKQETKESHHLNFVDLLAEKARKHRIPMASHDDDTPEKIRVMNKKQVTISEFPVNLQAAQAAVREGMHVIVGAPNIVRGTSISGNLRAIDAIRNGAAHILCSDYLPSSMLHAVFRLYRHHEMSMHEAVKMATLHPAQAAKISHERGSIECGKQADLVLVREIEQVPVVEQVFVKGVKVMETARRTAGKESSLV